MIQFRVLSFDDAELLRRWRNEGMSNLRTPYLITDTMQEEWYRRVVSNREARARWWGVYDDAACFMMPVGVTACGDVRVEYGLVGAAGLENIEWENRRAEVSLIIAPDARTKGVGRAAVAELLRRAWEELNLDSVYGEVYECGAVQFWRKVLPPETGWATLLRTKWWGGRYYGSHVFTVVRQ